MELRIENYNVLYSVYATCVYAACTYVYVCLQSLILLIV